MWRRAPPAGDAPGRSARHTALDLLSRREHSRAELRTKLGERGHADADITATLDRLVTEGLQSDARFAEQFVTSRCGRGQGPLRIRAELVQRGVEGALVEAALSLDEADWQALAAQARVRKFGAALPRDMREQARQACFLAQRGFSTAQIRAALRSAADETGP